MAYAANAAQKRKADAMLSSAEGEPVCVSTLAVRPGATNVLSAALEGVSGGDEEGAPSTLTASGFKQTALNTRYAVRSDVLVGGRKTYWSALDKDSGRSFFLALQPALGRWAICVWHGQLSKEDTDASIASIPGAAELECCQWQAFQLDPAVSQAQQNSWIGRLVTGSEGRWMEKTTMDASSWCRTSAQITALVPATVLRPSVRPSLPDLPHPAAIDFSGFRRLELNARYILKPEVVVNGKPTFWDASGVLFVYYQVVMKRWAISGRRHLETLRRGQSLGCACQLDQVNFSQPSRWAEYADGAWISAPVEMVVLPQDDEEEEET
eukprot:TRINITY_DN23048_c0_g1_i1.p1 TRINITY_DN23048_c0_g1~~TRINITY_DN23048_c0_g1_i1.p1  ORF type:complete len:362 (+),score=36.20 TRINITY_DN23048_c0_g1_i1:116-1087(+)